MSFGKDVTGLNRGERLLAVVNGTLPRSWQGESAPSTTGVGSRSHTKPFHKLFKHVTGWLMGMPFLAFLGIPLVALLLRISPADLVSNLRSPQVTQAVSLSLSTTLITVVMTIAFGTPLSYLLARRRLPLRRLVDTLVDLPTVLPPAVAGVALLMAFGRRGIFGSLLNDAGIQIAFTRVAVVMAQTFVASPFFIKAATLGFASVDSELQNAAALDGATTWQVFRHVTLPLAWAGMVSGSVMTWARALGEFGATIIFAGNYPGRTQTMPMAIYIGFEMDLGVALTLSAILVGCSFLVLMVVKWLFYREEEDELPG